MVKYIIIALYIILMVVVGILSSRKIHSNTDYFIAGKKGNFWQITGSLLATILGSSAILGTADLALTRGWAASWLLICASVGLFVLIPVSHLVRQKGKYTLPQMIGDFYGKEAKNISSLIIAFAWIGVIAAQIIGAAKVMQGFTGLDYSIGVWGSGLVFIFYTIIGGQVSVIKTDLYQTFIILSGILITALFIIFSKETRIVPPAVKSFPFNNDFSPFDLLVLLLTYSTTFIVGPDIYSRLFCAESKSTARKSVLWTAIVLIPFSLCITFIGVYASWKFPELDQKQGSALIPVMNYVLPGWCIGLLIAALLSAVMSSGATTLLTSALIIADYSDKGLDDKNSLNRTKIIMGIIGLLSIFLSLKISSIVESLLLALSFFSGAFIIPTLAGLLNYRTSKIQSTAAIIGGGFIALAGKIYSIYGDRITGNLIILSAFLINSILLFWFKPFALTRVIKPKTSPPVKLTDNQ
jgi:SSS family solute:Na+ symporter